MSLRWRLALALGLLGAVTVVAVASVAYAATGRQLRREADRFLADRTEAVIRDATGPRDHRSRRSDYLRDGVELESPVPPVVERAGQVTLDVPVGYRSEPREDEPAE